VTLQLAPITDADLSAVADFLHVNLNHQVSAATWRQICRISADPQVIEGTLVGPELKLDRDHAGTAAAHHLVPAPLFMLSDSRAKMYKCITPETPQIDDLYSELACVPW
jgi:hypothetical protein